MVPFALLTTLSLLGYHLTFDAEMSSPADMSQFINTFANGDTTLYNNQEAENYVQYGNTTPVAQGYAAPYQFGNGGLLITATPVPAGALPYTSGMLETDYIFLQSSGYFEIRASTPPTSGFWPAFWLLPTSYYPEIDVLEQPNNSGTTTEYWTHTSTPTDSSGGFTDTGVNVGQGYHTYGFLWTANTIQYVFDGNLVSDPHALPPSMVGVPMYMIANLAVGGPGSWPGVPAANAVSTYGIDYIRAFSNDPTMPEVAQQPISSPDGVDTTPMLYLPAPPTPRTVGTGLDRLVLQMSEDAYQGDAQFTVSINGSQHGAIQTTTAIHAAGQTQLFTFAGNFGITPHSVTVNFLNDASGSGGDRNLYLSGASYNGSNINGAVLNEYSGGPQSFSFSGKPVPAIDVGSGPDTLLFGISEDRGSQNAHYTISVDGAVQTPTEVANAIHGYGQSQIVAVHGTFGPGAHTVAVAFANGAAAANAPSPANLYIDGLSYDGIAVPNAAIALTQASTVSLQTAVQQPDTLSLALTENAYSGDAQAQISVDGVAVGICTITAPDGQTPQTVSYSGNWGGPAIAHVITVNYLNDVYVGPGQDRNLHVKGIVLDGTTITPQQANLMIGGPVKFNYLAPAPGPGWMVVAPASRPRQ